MRLTKRQWRMLAEVIVRLIYRIYPSMTMDAWEESEHKRDKDGKFAATEGGGGSSAEGKSTNAEEKSTQPLQKPAEHGIIEEGKKYALPEKYKAMTDKDVDAYFTDADGRNNLSKTFQKLPLEAKQTVVHGFDTAEKLFGRKFRMQSMNCGKLEDGNYGEYIPGKVSITYDPDKCAEGADSGEFYATTVHELVHHMQYRGGMDAKKIMTAVWRDKNNPYRQQDFKTQQLLLKFVGGEMGTIYDPEEVVAYAIEKMVTDKDSVHSNGVLEAIINQCKKKGYLKEET